MNGNQFNMKLLVCTVKPGQISGIVVGQTAVYRYLRNIVKYEISYFYYGQKTRGKERLLKKIVLRTTDLIMLIGRVMWFKPDIVHIDTAHDSKTLIRDFLTVAVLSILRQKKFIIIHGANLERIRTNRIFNILSKYIIYHSEGIGLLSTIEKKYLDRAFPRRKSFLVRCGLSPSIVKRVPARKSAPIGFTILFSGRIITQKGIFEAIEAMQTVVRRKPKTQMIIVGDGGQLREAKAMVKQYGLTNNIVFRGYVADDAAYFSYCDLFVLPTYYDEGFPTAIIKALFFGKPIITTKLRGARDYLKEPANCLWVKPKDARDLARQLLRIINAPGLRKIMSRNNHRLSGQFTDSYAAEQLRAVYRNILAD